MRFARNATSRQVAPEVPADAGPAAAEDPERSMMEAISRGSQEAFVMLFDHTAATIGAELTVRLRHPEQRAAILAATYVEVWWLAGCRSGTERDITRWIRRILDRRVEEANQATAQRVDGEPRPGRAELELAGLLGRPIDALWPV